MPDSQFKAVVATSVEMPQDAPFSNLNKTEPMDTQIPPLSTHAAPQPRTGLAIAALVLGILAVFASILVVGAFVGLLAILLGAIHISRRRGPNGMAWAGIGLSVLSIA